MRMSGVCKSEPQHVNYVKNAKNTKCAPVCRMCSAHCAQNESVKSMQTDVKSVQSVKSMQTDVKSMQSVKSVQTGQMRMSGALSLPLTVPIVALAPTLPCPIGLK